MNKLFRHAKALRSRRQAQLVYATIETEFDREHYLRRNEDIARAKIDPIMHYIRHGASEGRDPSPTFITRYYLNRYPDVARSRMNPFFHYLKFGRAEGRGATPFSAGAPNFDTVCKLLGRDPKDVEREYVERRADLRRRLDSGVLGEMVKKATELEPLVGHSWRAAREIQIPPFQSEHTMAQVSAIYRMQNEAQHKRARYVIAMRSGHLNGATRTAAHLAKALAHAASPEEIIVLPTDLGDTPDVTWFDPKTRFVNVARAIQELDQNSRQHVFVEFVRSLRPAAVFNVNSALLWGSMQPYGTALSRSSALYAYLFCNDIDAFGNSVGYPNRNFYRYFDLLSGVVTDSHYLAEELATRFSVPPGQRHKLVTLSTPIDPTLSQVSPSSRGGRRPRVFWAGRFDRQKRIDVVVAIAGRLPAVDFFLWGAPGLDNSFSKLKLPSNVVIRPPYRDLSDLPLHECDVWLYTSQWDGVPNVLCEVAGAGVPLVGSLSSGCGEVLIEGLSERVGDVEDIDAFVEAINRVLANPSASWERAAELRHRMLEQRSPTRYRAGLERLLAETLPQ